MLVAGGSVDAGGDSVDTEGAADGSASVGWFAT
jgi:hypothetical protein